MRKHCTCGNCKKVFVADVVKGAHRGKFCSLSCYWEWKAGKPTPHAAKRPGYMIYGGYRWIRDEHGVPKNTSQAKPRRSGRYIQEHVALAEKVLGRPLKKGEVVHHFNLDKLDNRPENLLICDNSYHRQLHAAMERAWVREHLLQPA